MVRICQDGHVSCQNIQVLHENMQMLELFSAVCVFVLSKCVCKNHGPNLRRKHNAAEISHTRISKRRKQMDINLRSQTTHR